MRREILRMERVSYQEHGSMVLDNLSLNIFEGEILGLVPINSFGVEALTDVLCHNLPLHYGYVYYRERLINTWRHSNTIDPRIALIQNQSSLAPDLTVLENICVLGPNFSHHLIRSKQLEEEYALLTKKLGVHLRSDAYADTLSVYERVVVELMKAIQAGCRLAILWDVSTFINVHELRKLHNILRTCAKTGMSFLYISPHLEDAEELCSRTLCMYNGQILKGFGQEHSWPNTFPFYGNQQYLDLVRNQITDHSHQNPDEAAAFEVRELRSDQLHRLSFQVKRGECLVLQDMDGCVTAELLGILRGEKDYEGDVLVGGMPLKSKNRRQIAVIQELATKTMLFPQMSYVDNLLFTADHRMKRIWQSSRLKRGIRKELESVLGSDVFDRHISELSERQKYDLVYTRVLLQHPDVVFCIFPFKGAEMTCRMHICELMGRLLEQKIAVVILAVNLADSLALADRVLQIQNGRQIRAYQQEDFHNLPNSTPWRRLYEDLAGQTFQTHP